MRLHHKIPLFPGGGNVMCVCLYQKSVCKEYRTRLQNSVTGFLMPDQRHFLSLYSYSLVIPREKPLLSIPKSIGQCSRNRTVLDRSFRYFYLPKHSRTVSRYVASNPLQISLNNIFFIKMF